MTTLNLSSTYTAGKFSYYRDGSNMPVVRYIYPHDLNGDGIDEILFAGFETQPNTPEQYSNTSLHIFGWVNGKLQEVSSLWLPNDTGLVEGVGDVVFGDFNGDKLVDVFLSAYTDMVHPVNAYALMNKGGYFEKVNLGEALWQHGVAGADINNDGFDDVFASGYGDPTIYVGSANGLVPKKLGDLGTVGNGSGIALADFLGNGTVSAITVDSWIDGHSETDFGLFAIDQNFKVTLFSTLPQSRLGADGHDVRVKAFDFSGDGLSDAVVFSRQTSDSNGSWPEISEIQFLLNKGNGVFSDVTDQVRVDYKRDTNISYNAIFQDFNRDGLIDIFSGESSWSAKHDSTTILLQNKDGKFVDFARSKLSALIDPAGGMSNIAMGPNGQYYLVGEKFAASATGLSTTVYSVALSFNNDPSVTQPIFDQVASRGLKFLYTLPSNTFTDVDSGDMLSLTASLESGKALPKWLKFDAKTQTFSGTPADADSNQTLQIKVTAMDKTKASVSDTFALTVESMNLAPVGKDVSTPVKATEGKAFSYALPKGTFVDSDKGDVMTYSLVSGPDWLSIASTTGKLSGIPSYAAADSATIAVKVKATDKAGASGAVNLNLSVANVSAIKGTAKSDVLTAGMGSDILSGGLGNDVLTGGAGSDRFVFDTKLDALNVDRITDFETGKDVMMLKGSVFSKIKGDKDLTDNVWTKAVGEQSALDYLVFDAGTGAVYYDADGSGQGGMIQFVTLVGVSEISAVDFLIA